MNATFDKSFDKSLDKLKNKQINERIVKVIEDCENAKYIKDIPNIRKITSFTELLPFIQSC